MKKLLLLGLLFSITLKAQKTHITQGLEFSLEKNKWINVATDHDSTGFYYFRGIGGYYSSRYVLQKFDLKKASTIFEKYIDLSGDDYLGGKGYFQGVYNKNGKILVFSQASKGKKNQFMMQEFSCKTGEALGKPVVIDEMDDTKSPLISESVLDFHVSFSPDGKKMLVVAELKRDNKLQNVTAKLYNTSNYKNIWEKEPITTYGNSSVSSSNYCVDNDGTLSYLFLFLRSNKEKSYLKGKTIFFYKDYAHGIGFSKATTSNHKTVEIPSTGITTINPKLEILNNQLVCTGQFLEGEHMNPKAEPINNTGFFLLTLDLMRGELQTKSFDMLNEDIRFKLAYKDKGKMYGFTGNKEYTAYKTLWIDNCFYQVQLRTIDNAYVKSFGKEIIIYKYDRNHKLQWMKMIPRSTTAEANGVNYLTSKKLNLFYYESPENLLSFPSVEEYDPKKYKTVKDAKKATLVCAGIDEKGHISREQVQTNGENLVLDETNYQECYIRELNAIIVPAKISESLRRYDIISVED